MGSPMTIWDPPTRRLVVAAGGLSLVAGLIHLLVAPEHFAEYWAYGAFFVVAFVAQAANGLILLWEGSSTRARPGWWRRAWTAMLWTGLAGNFVLVAFWAYTRFVGVPLGPAAGEKEEMAFLDLFDKAVEVALLVALLGLLRYGPRAPAESAVPS